MAKTLIKHNICGKLLSSLDLSSTFDEKLEATRIPFFIFKHGLLSCELENFIFKEFYVSISFCNNVILKQNKIVVHAVAKLHDADNTFTITSEKFILIFQKRKIF